MQQEIFHNARILIVDDEVDNLDLLHSILQFGGYNYLHSTATPHEVQSLYAAFQPDLILLDLIMPDLDGFQVMAQLKAQIPEDDYMPVLVITGDYSEETRHRALASGARDFLTRPFDTTEVLLRVRNLLETRFLHLELQVQNQLLEEKVRQRTSELTQVYVERDQLRSEMLLAEAQRLTHVGSWHWNVSHDVLDWSDELYRIHGLSLQADIATCEDFMERVHPADRQLVKSVCDKALREHEPFDFHYRAVRTDGTIRNLHSRGVVVIDENGNPIRMLGSSQDVTDLKQAEAALEESRDELQTVLNAVPGGVAWIGSDLRYLGINSYLARLFNVTLDQVIGQKVGFLQRDSEFVDFVRDFFAKPGRAAEREVAIEAAGTKHIFWVMARKYEHGQGAVFAGVDVTERTQAEAALQDAHDEMERRVQERTTELQDVVAALRTEITERAEAEADAQQARVEAEQAKALADRANRAKSEFLSRMSHELRTPLNAILGFSQLLALDERPARERQNLEYIRKAGQHLLALINEVLEIARIETGQMSFSIEPVHVATVLQEGIDLVRPLAADRQVQIQMDETCNQWVLADRQRLKQVLLNLLSNAVKYNRLDGEVRTSCQVEDLVPSNGHPSNAHEEVPAARLRILVTDTGLGMVPEMQERLFTPFDRLGAEQSGIEGTGIGLALSKRLVEAMGGIIGVESTAGEGSTFWVGLPLTQNPVAGLADTETAEMSPEPTSPHRTQTILYIEDNLSNLRLIESILVMNPGVRLLAAMQGGLGLELARLQQPDAILLDLHLPDMPGEEVLQRLKADPTTRSIPVIVLSADAVPSRIDRLLAGGADAYLTKPLQVRQFLQVLEATLPKEPTA